MPVSVAGFTFWTVLISVVCVRGQAPCVLADVPLLDNFDLNKFLGTWYEIEWIAPSYMDSGKLWINYYHVYTADVYGTVTGYYSGKDPHTAECFLGGMAILETNDHPSRLLQYSGKVLRDYWVLDTDYNSYAVVYSCLDKPANNNGSCSRARSWLWARSKTLPEEVKASARTQFQNLCMNMTLLYETGFRGEDCKPETSRAPLDAPNGHSQYLLGLIVAAVILIGHV